MGTSISRSTGNNTPIELATNVTFLEATTHITNSTLETGMFYLMTDFETIYDQPDYSDANTPKVSVATKLGGITPILLLATSTNTFAKEVWMPSRPQWKFEYDINFTQTEYMNAPAKGRITWAKDEFNNETTYDHDVVLLKRYESVSGSGVYDYFWDTGFASVEVKTFEGTTINSKIVESGFKYGMFDFLLNNTFFNEACVNTTLGIASNNNTFISYCDNNIFPDFTFRNIFYGDTENNIFRKRVENNTFNGDLTSNHFNEQVVSNIFSSDVFSVYADTQVNVTDFTSATHVYANYPCRIFARQDGTVRLSYTDNTDTFVVVNPTD